jgi:hypothetical protein
MNTTSKKTALLRTIRFYKCEKVVLTSSNSMEKNECKKKVLLREEMHACCECIEFLRALFCKDKKTRLIPRFIKQQDKH